MPALLGKEKTHESKVRRWAARLGYSLVKSRKQIARDNHGKYMLLDARKLVIRGRDFDASLADVEAFLQAEEARLRG
jgi:hypothetical protein